MVGSSLEAKVITVTERKRERNSTMAEKKKVYVEK